MEERGGMLVDGGEVGGHKMVFLVLSSSPIAFVFLCCLVHRRGKCRLRTYDEHLSRFFNEN